eukprot:scaffold229_cov136-Cylindrotheca_fusiformis.AAC.6
MEPPCAFVVETTILANKSAQLCQWQHPELFCPAESHRPSATSRRTLPEISRVENQAKGTI